MARGAHDECFRILLSLRPFIHHYFFPWPAYILTANALRFTILRHCLWPPKNPLAPPGL